MSISREHYLGRLAALRIVQRGLVRMNQGASIPGEFVLAHIKDTQYRLRRICGVPKQSDRIFGR